MRAPRLLERISRRMPTQPPVVVSATVHKGPGTDADFVSGGRGVAPTEGTNAE